jgi:NAD(P)-dependent dehydrogenase (short-subunit alcohol dehydrogenase family)
MAVAESVASESFEVPEVDPQPSEEAWERNVALVTGVGRAEGIGFEVCRQLATRGFAVLLTSRSEEKARDLAGRLVDEGLDVRPEKLDVASPDDFARLAALVETDWGRLDVLINNAAGLSAFGEKPSSADLEAAHEVLETTLFGSWRACQTFLPLLRKGIAPRIVNVSSGAGSHSDPLFGLTSGNGMGPSYAISKAALNALTTALAQEVRTSGILVNAVCPGFTATSAEAEEMGARPVSAGAKGIVWAATLPDDGPSGGFFRDGEPLAW